MIRLTHPNVIAPIAALTIMILAVRCTPVPKAQAQSEQNPTQVQGGVSTNQPPLNSSMFAPEGQPGQMNSSISRTAPSIQSGFGNVPGQSAGTLGPLLPAEGNPPLSLSGALNDKPAPEDQGRVKSAG